MKPKVFHIGSGAYKVSYSEKRFSISGPGVDTARFKYRENGFIDCDGKTYDEIVISQIQVAKSAQRHGLGTSLIREVAKLYPNALIIGENPNSVASAWHANRLNKALPTRMLDFNEARLTPGSAIDHRELLPQLPPPHLGRRFIFFYRSLICNTLGRRLFLPKRTVPNPRFGGSSQERRRW